MFERRGGPVAAGRCGIGLRRRLTGRRRPVGRGLRRGLAARHGPLGRGLFREARGLRLGDAVELLDHGAQALDQTPARAPDPAGAAIELLYARLRPGPHLANLAFGGRAHVRGFARRGLGQLVRLAGGGVAQLLGEPLGCLAHLLRLALSPLPQLLRLATGFLAILLRLAGGRLADLLSLPLPLLDSILGPRARAGGDLLRRLVGALEQPVRLLGHLLEGVPDRRLRRRGHLQLRDHAVHLLDVAIDGVPVVAPQGDGEIDVPHGPRQVRALGRVRDGPWKPPRGGRPLPRAGAGGRLMRHAAEYGEARCLRGFSSGGGERLAPAARIDSREAKAIREVEGSLELVATRPPIDLLELVGATGGVVLAHQVDVGVGTELIGDEAKDRLGLVEESRHHEVTDDEPFSGESAVIEDEVADLAMHLLDVRAHDVGVLALAEVATSVLPRPELDVGHVDVHDALHQLEAVRAVVGARVVDDRQLEALAQGDRERLEDLRHDMLGRDPVDVVTAVLLELEHHAGQALAGDLLALDLPADVEVLAEDAAQVAAAEEDRARAAPAAQAVLLAEVREVGRHHRPSADAT